MFTKLKEQDCRIYLGLLEFDNRCKQKTIKHCKQTGGKQIRLDWIGSADMGDFKEYNNIRLREQRRIIYKRCKRCIEQ